MGQDGGVERSERAGVSVAWLAVPSSSVLAAWGKDEVESLAGPAAVARAAELRREVDALDHVAVRALARRLAAHVSERPVSCVALRQRCLEPGCRRAHEHGAPELTLTGGPAASVSWSHSAGLLACAVALSGAPGGPPPVGIDLEPIGEGAPPLVDTWAQWVRAEACVKAGLADLDEALAVSQAVGPLPGAPAAERSSVTGRDAAGALSGAPRGALLGASFAWDGEIALPNGPAAVAIVLGRRAVSREQAARRVALARLGFDSLS
jgi:hypothetical protein